jgi:hypothetical protein
LFLKKRQPVTVGDISRQREVKKPNISSPFFVPDSKSKVKSQKAKVKKERVDSGQ